MQGQAMIAKKDKWRALVEECFRPLKKSRFSVDSSLLFAPALKSKGRKEIRKMAWTVAREVGYEFGVPVWQAEYKPAPTLPSEEDFAESELVQESHFLASTKFHTIPANSVRKNPRHRMFIKTGAI
jgi:hypothetical protein